MVDNKNTIILGIDPGYERLGISILEINQNNHPKEKLIFSDCFTTNKKDPHERRLGEIMIHIEKIIKKYKPNILAIEKVFFTVNQKTAMAVAESRGVILAVAGSMNVKIIEFSPTEIKSGVAGYGNANKKDIKFMVPKILKTNLTTTQDDEIDAIAIAICASATLRFTIH